MARRRKTVHNLSHYKLYTAEMGWLIPAGCIEVMAGDEFRHQTSVMVRMSPLAAPVMHPISVRIHHFYCPTRILWPSGQQGWEDFITGGPDGTDTSLVPQIKTTGLKGDALDYLGCPLKADVDVSSLPLRGYNMIWNEWYRDQDLQAAMTDFNLTDIRAIAWEKDYFSTARPWAQKGAEVTLPLGTQAPVQFEGSNDFGAGGATHVAGTAPSSTWSGTAPNVRSTGIFADLTAATAAKINDLRRAAALQRFAENRARLGSRFPEYLRFLGAPPVDGRLQRPELLGSSSSQMAISEVLQTANEAGATTPRFGVGDLYGHGVAAARGNRYVRSFPEHGYVYTMVSVRPRAMYTQGLDRTWLRRTREDYYQPELAHIGQQQVKEQEVYATTDNAANVFGWQDRYEEYRYQRSTIAGDFRQQLNYWHMGREFQAAPALNATFVKCEPTKRIYNEQTQHALWCMASHDLRARRIVTADRRGRLL